MVKIRIFESYYVGNVEAEVNHFLESYQYSDIINIQYQPVNAGSTRYTVCITYRDDS